MKEVSKDFYSDSNSKDYNDEVQGSRSYDEETERWTVTHYEE